MKKGQLLLALTLIVASWNVSCASLGGLEKSAGKRRNSLFGSFDEKPQQLSRNSQEFGNTDSQKQPKQKANGSEFMTARNSGLPLQKIEGNTWRTNVSAQTAFIAISKTLAKSYTITANDRKNLSIQTDWDKFFVEGRLFRNKVNISVFPVSARSTEVVIRNSLEYFTSSSGSENEQGTWLPCPDITDEVKRIVDSSSATITKIARDSQLTY
jgi:hypothetical protein